MKIQQENLEELTYLLRVTVGEADYGEAVEKILRDYKKKANVPGFRPGMVPMGVVNKMYRKGTVAEEAYRTASKAAFDHIEKENIDQIGDLLPSEKQKEFDFDNNTEHEFVFEYATAPAVNIELGAKDKLNRYVLKITREMHDGSRKNFMGRYGQLVDADQVTGEEALTVNLDNGEMQIEEAYVGLINMSDEERKPFIGKKVGDEMDVDVNELYKNPSQRASILGVKEGELAAIDPKFKLTIARIRKFAEPELNEEFFKMAFPEGNVTNEQELDRHIDAQIAQELSRETNYLFTLELRELLLAKADLKMPEPFLKRWLLAVNEGKFSEEDIERDFAPFLKMMQWNVVKKHYIETLDLNVNEEEALDEAKAMTRMQFAQYGMGNVPDEMLTNYATGMLENREEQRKILERLYERKVIEALTPMVNVAEKSIDVEEFGKLAEKYQ